MSHSDPHYVFYRETGDCPEHASHNLLQGRNGFDQHGQPDEGNPCSPVEDCPSLQQQSRENEKKKPRPLCESTSVRDHDYSFLIPSLSMSSYIVGRLIPKSSATAVILPLLRQ